MVRDIIQPAARERRTSPGKYTIRQGDTLSSIAARFCGSAGRYPNLAAANGIVNPDLIITGKQLALGCHYVALSSAVRPARPARQVSGGQVSGGRVWGVTHGYPNLCGDGDGDGWDVSCSRLHHDVGGSGHGVSYARPAARAQSISSGGYSVSGSFQRCVIARESGGNTQVMNGSGHYGLYQFSASTWAAYGGDPGMFGHASGAYQTQIFNNAMAKGGQGNWSPYDGC